MSVMTGGERFVHGLAAALPEAFAGRDLSDAYDYSAESASDEDPWAMTIALADAVRWLEDHVLDVDRRAQTCAVRPTGPETLQRFFAYIEQVLDDTDDGSRTGWIRVELFEGVPWTEDVIGYLGPRTTALLRDAQQTLQPCNAWIGRWSDADC